MVRHARLRPFGRGLLAIGLTVGGTFAAVPPAAAAPAVPAEVVLPPTPIEEPRLITPLAGDHGIVARVQGRTPPQWYPAAAPSAPTALKVNWERMADVVTGADGHDVLIQYDRTVATFVDLEENTSHQVRVVDDNPDGTVGVFGHTIVSRGEHDGVLQPRLTTVHEDGTSVSRWISGLPDDVSVVGYKPSAGDDEGLVFPYRTAGGSTRLGYVESETGHLAELARDLPASPFPQAALGPDRIVWRTGGTELSGVERTAAGPGAAIPGRTLPDGTPVALVGVVGDDLLLTRDAPASASGPWSLAAVPLSGDGGYRTLLPSMVDLSAGGTAMVPWSVAADGSVVVAGGTDADDWGAQRISADADGRATAVRDVPVTRRWIAHNRVVVAQGLLDTGDGGEVGDDTPTSGWYSLDRKVLATQGAPELRSSLRLSGNPGAPDFCCTELVPSGDGRLIYLTDDGLAIVPGTAGGTIRVVPMDRSPGRLQAAGRNAIVHRYHEDGRPYYTVVDLDSGKVVRDIPRGDPMSLWGDTVWTPGSTPGTVVGADVRTGAVKATVRPVTTCAVNSIQVVGSLLKWGCPGSGPNGVYDMARKAPVMNLVGGQRGARLGDGYLVWPADKNLVLTDLRSASHPERSFGAIDPGRAGNWDLDRYGGHPIWVDAAHNIHVAPTGIAASALSVIDRVTPAAVDDKSANAWKARWWLSKPAASWKVTVRNKATGATVRTFSGGEARGLVSVSWDGRDAAGRYPASGTYTWTLTAAPADGTGAALSTSGTVRLVGGVSVFHDGSGPDGLPDGSGDLLTLSGDGWLTWQLGNGKGGVSGKTGGKGWANGTVAVPFGDMGADRCNDVLVRLPSGELRRYAPACGKAVSPTTSHTSLGTGWNQYKTLASSGDLTGDGRPDLIAWHATTGDVYVCADNGKSGFKSRVKIVSGWKYLKLISVGDLNGDSIGDLLALDHGYTLWRYLGKPGGGFGARQQIWTDWGKGYNVIAGVGDITGDGKVDIVERDSAGTVWRNAGNGKGGFGGRAQVVTGWKGYSTIF